MQNVHQIIRSCGKNNREKKTKINAEKSTIGKFEFNHPSIHSNISLYQACKVTSDGQESMATLIYYRYNTLQGMRIFVKFS